MAFKAFKLGFYWIGVSALKTLPSKDIRVSVKIDDLFVIILASDYTTPQRSLKLFFLNG